MGWVTFNDITSGGSLEMLILRGLKMINSMSTTAPSFLPSTTTLGKYIAKRNILQLLILFQGLNSIFMVSSGKVTAFGPDGEILWDVESRANWRPK